MKTRLDQIRKPEDHQSLKTSIMIIIGIVIGGFMLGILQKWLDASSMDMLPTIINQLDIRNYFGRLSIWILLATIISVYSKTPLKASIHTFMFFISMLAGYYLYCYYVLGFLSISYMMIWIYISFVSFFMACVCWYAKGEGIIAIIISSIILGVLFSQAILITQGIYVTHILDVITWLIGILVLYRKPKELGIELVLSLFIAVIYQMFIPYWG